MSSKILETDNNRWIFVAQHIAFLSLELAQPTRGFVRSRLTTPLGSPCVSLSGGSTPTDKDRLKSKTKLYNTYTDELLRQTITVSAYNNGVWRHVWLFLRCQMLISLYSVLLALFVTTFWLSVSNLSTWQIFVCLIKVSVPFFREKFKNSRLHGCQTWGDYSIDVIDYDYLPPARLWLRLRITKITM